MSNSVDLTPLPDIDAGLREAEPVLSDSGGDDLGPQTLTWKFYGDIRQGLTFQRLAGNQNSIAQLAQGVEEHSAIFSDFSGRAERTVPPIMKTVYSDSQSEWGRKVRDFHRPIKGVMPDGSRYHAMNPELFYWAHATFVEGLIYGTDTFIRRLSHAEKEQIFTEGKLWYAKYGISDRSQPQTYAEFCTYWDEMTARFAPNRTITYATGYLRKGIPRPRTVPAWAWVVLGPLLNRSVSFLAIGTVVPAMREICDLPWSDAQERRFQRFARVVRALNPVFNRLPMKVLYISWAREAWERVGIDPRPLRNRPA